MFLVTGATGNVGGEVVEQLLADGHAVGVYVRDPAKAARWGGRVRVVAGDFDDPAAFAAAAATADGVFLMNGAPDAGQVDRLAAAVAARGRPPVVFLSTLLTGVPGVRIGEIHQAKEQALAAAGLPATVLRPGAFMSNAYQWLRTIKAEGVVFNATGAGRTAPIAPEDIAAVAVAALTGPPGRADKVVDLTGGELLTVPEQVDVLAGALGRPLRCVDIPVATAVANFVRAGIPESIASAVGQSFEQIRDGRAAHVTDAVARLTGRPPMSFADWARRHASRFA